MVEFQETRERVAFLLNVITILYLFRDNEPCLDWKYIDGDSVYGEKSQLLKLHSNILLSSILTSE